jgi:hypothetical protein
MQSIRPPSAWIAHNILVSPSVGKQMSPRQLSKRPKVLSSTEITARAQRFTAKWKNEGHENAEAQSWWNDFFEVFGVDRYSTATFERWARRASTGHNGRIDVFVPGLMIAEHKSLGRDLEGAGNQADDYLAGGDISPQEMPRYIVTSDFAEVQITDLESPLDPPYRFPITKLAKNISRFAFLSGYRAPKRAADQQRAVSIKAARAMGALYEALLGDVDANSADHEAEQASIFMTRMLFLLYGDDAEGLWEDDAFQNFILESTSEDGSDAGALIAQLFQVLDTKFRSPKLDAHMGVFPYVNGACFAIEWRSRSSILRCALPSSVPRMRSGLKSHLLFSDPCSKAWPREQNDTLTASTTRPKLTFSRHCDHCFWMRSRNNSSRPGALKPLWSFEHLRYLDPACGSGNFLIVAYREMRDIELRLLQRLRALRGQESSYTLDATWDLKVTADQFYGIEINSWPAQIAQTAMFLTEHQANTKMAHTLGGAPPMLPIGSAAKIVHADALLLDWMEEFPTGRVTTYVFGNPPFLGKTERGPAQIASMKAVWGKDYSGEMDYVTSWFIKARHYLTAAAGRFAFVATNSISQGTNAPPLFSKLITDGWRIRFAHRAFLWKSEATGPAHVHCVIVGFDHGENTNPRLFNYETVGAVPVELDDVAMINAYLIDAPNIYVSELETPLNASLTSSIGFGSMAADGKNLTLTPGEADALRSDPATATYARRFIGATELINNRIKWVLWMPASDPEVIRTNPIIRSHVDAVRRWRTDPKRDPDVAKSAAYPYRFHRPKQPVGDFLCIPRHFSETRDYATVAYFSDDYVPGDATFHTKDPDGLFFAVLSSSMFMTWQKTVGGRLKSDPRFASTLTWNTYPLPQLDPSARLRLIDAGQSILDVRRSLAPASLASLYDPPLCLPSFAPLTTLWTE